jgi:AcrR family transcriptional regulator
MSKNIVKSKQEAQRKKIVQGAIGLFVQKGYRKTSVDDIIKTLGISKGTFYHYFDSKEDLLDKVCVCMSEEILVPLKKIVDDKKLNALDKLVKSFELVLKYKKANKELVKVFVEALYKTENIILMDRLRKNNIELIVPEFTKIIEQGKKEKIFDVTDPQETAEMIIHLQTSYLGSLMPKMLGKEDNKKILELFEKKAQAFEDALIKLLGIKDENIKIINRNDQRSILKSTILKN